MVNISIVIPVFNSGTTMIETINRIKRQTASFYELIIVDDGSTDDSYENCMAACEGDKRIRVIHTENKGSGPARTLGTSYATGDYVYYPDADDVISAKAVEMMTAAIEKTRCDLLVFGFETVYPNGKTEIKKYANKIECGQEIRANYSDYCNMEAPWAIQGAPWNKVFQLDLIRKHHITFPALRRHQDEAFIASYVCHAEKIAFIDKVLYTYYANDIRGEWKKYPRDYTQAVQGLIENRASTILTWNSHDYATHARVSRELVCKSAKALETLFSPKQGALTYRERTARMRRSIDGLYFDACLPEAKKEMSAYHRLVLLLAGKRRVHLLYFLLRLKTLIEQHNTLFSFAKKLLGSKA